MRKKSPYTLLMLLVLTCCTFLFFSCKNGRANNLQNRSKTPELAVETMDIHDIIVDKKFPTTLEGQQNVEIRPKITAFIKDVHVDEGQTVQAGQLLFTLETNTIAENADVKKSQMKVAEVELERIKPLVEKGIINPIQLEMAQANYQKAMSDYHSAQTIVDYSRIKSPTNGVIGDLPFKAGSLVSPTTTVPLTTVSNISNVHAYFSMSEKEYLGFVKQGQWTTKNNLIEGMPPVKLLLADGSLYELDGKIEAINGITNHATGSITIRGIFANPHRLLRSGSSGTILLPYNRKRVFLLPQSAVFERQDKQMVYLVGKDNKVYAKVVDVGEAVEDYYVINRGLSKGDVVVLEGVFKIKEDQSILPKMQVSKVPVHSADSGF